MEIKSVNNDAFVKYGKVIEGIDFSQLLEELGKKERPADSVIYVPSDEKMESLPVFNLVQNNLYGGMPVQIGYCNGDNKTLNCLEYHRGSEMNIAYDDVVLLLAPAWSLKKGVIDSSQVEAFSVKAGTAVLLYETSLHYAPCTGEGNEGFRVAIILPKDTNTEKPDIEVKTDEDLLLWAKNKWLIAHSDSGEAKQGAFVGITGENINLGGLL